MAKDVKLRIFGYVFWCFLVLLTSLGTALCQGTSVSYITPQSGGIGGQVKVTIVGSGFSQEKFSLYSDTLVGNSVYLVNKHGSEQACSVQKEGSNPSRILFYTPSGLKNGDSYNVKVIVDGQSIEDESICSGNPTSGSCSFKLDSSDTPTIFNVEPQTGFPGSKVNISGRIFTDRYTTDVETASNGKVHTLQRAYVGPYLCDLHNGTDTYGIYLDNANSNNGLLECTTTGASVGFYNVSFLVDPPYGSSIASSNLFHVSYNDVIYLYQFYTEITNISHQVGSVYGGLILTIYGKHINTPQNALPRAYIDDTICVVTEVLLDSAIKCIVASRPATTSSKFEGNRGVTYEYWTNVSMINNDIDWILSLDSSDPNYHSEILDMTSLQHNDEHRTRGNHANKLTFFFKPPHSGYYDLKLVSHGKTKMFIDGLTKMTLTRSSTEQIKQQLDGSKKYLFEIINYSHDGHAYIHLSAKCSNTTLTKSSVSKADQEKQRIRIKSKVVLETQELKFMNLTKQEHVEEVQSVVIEYADGFFRLGMYGVYTEPLIISMMEHEVAHAIQALPIWGLNESIEVNKTHSTTSIATTYLITIISRRGSFPYFDVIDHHNSEQVPYSVTKDTPGIPDLDVVALMLDGVISEPFSIEELNAGNISLQSIIANMFTSNCPYEIDEGNQHYYNSFERSSVSTTDAFCGRHALKNPKTIFKTYEGVQLIKYGMFCFAYKGFFNNIIYIRFSFDEVEISNQKDNHNFYHYFQADFENMSQKWYYTCIDMYSIVARARPSSTNYRLLEVTVSRLSHAVDTYVDSVSLGAEPTTLDTEVHLRRREPAHFRKAFIEGISVTSNTFGSYIVTIKPYNCGFDFPLFEIARNNIEYVETETTTLPSTSTTPTSDTPSTTVSDLPADILIVKRISEASPPVLGLIDVKFKEHERKGVNISISAFEFGQQLQSINGIGSLHITKNGDCANFDMITHFITLAGDQPQMKINDSQVEGIEASVEVITDMNGGLNYNPLMGDMVSTVHILPQVRLYINDVPTTCTGNCSFNWDPAVTPSVTAVAPQSGSSAIATSVVISGTGFSTNSTQNKVTIGGIECMVRDSRTNELVCDVGNGPLGPQYISVTVDGKGQARGNINFTYISDVTSINPTSGSLGGGNNLTIVGYGFRNNVTVLINGNDCDITSVIPSSIICTTPASDHEDVFNVHVVESDSESKISQSFEYKYELSKTSMVDRLVPGILNVTGGDITIYGSSFTLQSVPVYIGTTQCIVIHWSDSRIDCNVQGLDSGWLQVKIDGSHGYAVNTTNYQVPKVYVDFRITNVHPLQGSIFGGTKLTIKGSGFGRNMSSLKTAVGDVDCSITNLTETQIICQLDYTGKTYYVTNKGVDPAFGVYYAFDKPFITIEVGDFVQWSWETPFFVNNVKPAIIEIESPSSLIKKEGGFSSGVPKKNGVFRHRFTTTGQYYVWSGYVDEWEIKNYAGTIVVVDRKSTSDYISVRIGRAEAEHIVGDNIELVDSAGCSQISTRKTACNDAKASVNNTNKYSHAFWTCSTPIVRSINVNNGTIATDIIITGKGFSSKECQNEVLFGRHRCNVTLATTDSLTCRLVKNDDHDIARSYELTITVNNRGFARIDVTSFKDYSFTVLPSVESISPVRGSLAGGAHLTVTGYGFQGTVLVNVGFFNCIILESSYFKIVCEAPASDVLDTEDIEEVAVFVYIQGMQIKAKCETLTGECTFSYGPLWTPIATSITPNAFTWPFVHPFNVTGSQLGYNVDEINVSFGTASAKVITAADKYFIVEVDNMPAGENDVMIKIKDYGKASGSLKVMSPLYISSIYPTAGSIYGKTLITVSGNGFVENHTTVYIDEIICSIATTTLSNLTCLTQQHILGSYNVKMQSNGISANFASFRYAIDSTPTVTYINPNSGFSGDLLTLHGSNLNNGSLTVLLGQSFCEVIARQTDKIECVIGNHPTGVVAVSVLVTELGLSNTNVQFEYQLSLTNITPIQGGLAGGQIVTMIGTGIDSSVTAYICEKPCLQPTTTSTNYICRTPANSAQVCDIAISVNGLTKRLSNAYQYMPSLTSTITSVSPRRGGTGGGTELRILGENFGTEFDQINVTIDNVACVLTNISNTEINCVTGPHTGSVLAKIEVQVSNNGIAKENVEGAADFHFIDVWSSSFTWGGGPLPQEGEFVVIPPGSTILLDTDTPVLSVLLIQGGHLIFDAKNIELQADVIMITEDGRLEVGTENKPFQHIALLTLHGHLRSKELPIYGTKVLAVRNGTLDLHGTKIPTTWTQLSATASEGSKEIYLKYPVKWTTGDEIVIASTGSSLDEDENEKKIISSVSIDGTILTLTTPLKFTHAGVQEMYNGQPFEKRAEVGLLTRSVVVRGNDDSHWHNEDLSCKQGLDFGHFTTNRCSYSGYRREAGSNQFGVVIFVHPPVQNAVASTVHMSYTEVRYAGQTFRSGRHPINFYLNGNMSGSYVHGCSFHNTFNRAVNVQGTQNIRIEQNVLFDILGSGFVLEDGSEVGIVLSKNLAVKVSGCSTLTNDDLAPAAFSLANPNNSVQYNAVAGGTHHGFWYRPDYHSVGTTYTYLKGKQSIPLGSFLNNSAHSLRGFGLFVYKNYFPKIEESNKPTIFNGFISWNNKKGAFAGNIGIVQFINFFLVQNRLAGIEINSILDIPKYMQDSPSIQRSIIIGQTSASQTNEHGCTQGGIVLPLGRGFTVKNVSFVNFNDSNSVAFSWTRLGRRCPTYCGGFTYHIENMRYINTPNRAVFEWDWEGIFLDKDGTTAMKDDKNWTIIPTTGTVPPDCEHAPEFSIGSNASLCPPKYHWKRYVFYGYRVNSYRTHRPVTIINMYGNSTVPYARPRFTPGEGWMCALLSNTSYKFYVDNISPANNISYQGIVYDLNRGDYLTISMDVPDFPDWYSINGNKINASSEPISHENGTFGDWHWHNLKKELTFLVKVPHSSSIQQHTDVDIGFSFWIFKCFYTDCIPPPDPNTSPPAPKRVLNYQYWHDKSIWNRTNDMYMTNVGKIGNSIPADFDNVKILPYTWVLVNFTNICKLNTLLLYGILEFIDGPEALYRIEAELIIIKGGRLIIGWPDKPFIGHASIILYGNDSPSSFNPKTGVTLRRKTIGVFGGLDLYGRDIGTPWTSLKVTANVGQRRIVLAEKVQWLVGDEIVLSSTGFGPWLSETFKIKQIGNDRVTIELNDTLKFKHIVHQEILPNGQIVTLRSAVGLLTRNIKIIGSNPGEGNGARVLVGLYSESHKTYKGYARISNVEFYHTGRMDSADIYDPYYSLAFVDVGQVNYIKPSVVANCSFHNGFSTAVGLIGIRSATLTNSVVYNTHGYGILTTSPDTKLIRNLVIKVMGVGIEGTRSKNLILQENLVSSSDAIAYKVPAISCDETVNVYRDNKMYSNVAGAVISDSHFLNDDCVKIIGFTAWKNIHIGLFYLGKTSAVFERNVLIENQIGVSAFILSTRIMQQMYFDISILIRNSTFIGQTSSFNCGDMVWVRSNRFKFPLVYELNLNYLDGMVGIVFPQFNTIGGLTKIENVTFVRYGKSNCLNNYVITTNLQGNELQRPMHSEKTSLSEVSQANKILFLRSRRTNQFSCFSIECDVVRFAAFVDLDGTFLKNKGTLIQKSEYEEIDYTKVPREITTLPNGTSIPIEKLAPNKGVVRNENCTYEEMWQAYSCKEDIKYRVLLMKNLDSDAKYRQLSPIALLADGFLDILDAPLDNGQCIQHFCRNRNTMFNVLIVAGRTYVLHFARTTPRNMRYQLLNVDQSEGITLTVWYSRPNRLDVFVNGKFMIATNARIDINGRYILSMSRGGEFIPHLLNETGTNYFDRARGEMTVIIKGPAQIDVISQETVIVSFGFPAMSYSELYGQNIVENLAAFLDIPLTKVRIVNVVSESRNGRRKRSEDDYVNLDIEIGDEPKEEMNMTIDDSLDYSTLAELVSQIVNECQLGNISNVFGDAVVCGIIHFAPYDLDVATIIYSNQYPVHLYFYDEPKADYENVSLKIQPKIRAFDSNGLNVTSLGTTEYPWQMSVSLRNGSGHPLAVLSGTLTINCTDGWFNFTDLAISLSGPDYVLDFNIVYPEEAEHFILKSEPFSVNGRPLKLQVQKVLMDELYAFEPFTVTLNLLDLYTEEVITNIKWRDHKWTAEVRLIRDSVYANLSGVLNTSFNDETGQATFDNLSVSGIGLYYLNFEVKSDPPEYNLYFNWMVTIVEQTIANFTIEETATIKVKFNTTFGDVLNTEDEVIAFEQTFLTELANVWKSVRFLEGRAYEGSISVEYVIAGTFADINATVHGICEEIHNGSTFMYNNHSLLMMQFMTINNKAFYGVECGPIPSNEGIEDNLLTSWLFILSISIGCMIIVIAVITCVIRKVFFVPKTKIQSEVSRVINPLVK